MYNERALAIAQANWDDMEPPCFFDDDDEDEYSDEDFAHDAEQCSIPITWR